LNIKLDEDEIQALMRKYRLPSGLINYSAFCDRINEVFNKDNLGQTAILSKGLSSARFTDEEMQILFQTLSDIKQIVKANRILLKPSFQDFDPTNIQHITIQQFSRVLK